MTHVPNPHRGETGLIVSGREVLLRPSFSALVALEDELGSLLALVERAGRGELRLAELAALFWHCLAEHQAITRDEIGEAVIANGLAACTKPLRVLLRQILRGVQ